ncbi:hypothetical protein [Lichenibacterium ramalinae]|uniref:Uncharacterized protein n=1 Tax=Lichenibacterium ramalinae TaxID=2316527 RepID=A0A4V1RI32_9HYPH|nr:hypothetical protein [Lichenibacterium ramalinae]RYB02137.1 hypothetical protein D3272_22720 [Lichenibacterium ramalinae]
MIGAPEIDGFESPVGRAAWIARDQGISMQDFVVTEEPRRHARTLLQTDSRDLAQDFVERHVGPPSTRLVLWWPDASATAGPEVTVAVPLGVYRTVEAWATCIVEDWNASWLLIDPAAPGQREATRGHLVGAIAVALLSAAVTGLDEVGEHVGI